MTRRKDEKNGLKRASGTLGSPRKPGLVCHMVFERPENNYCFFICCAIFLACSYCRQTNMLRSSPYFRPLSTKYALENAKRKSVSRVLRQRLRRVFFQSLSFPGFPHRSLSISQQRNAKSGSCEPLTPCCCRVLVRAPLFIALSLQSINWPQLLLSHVATDSTPATMQCPLCAT